MRLPAPFTRWLAARRAEAREVAFFAVFNWLALMALGSRFFAGGMGEGAASPWVFPYAAALLAGHCGLVAAVLALPALALLALPRRPRWALALAATLPAAFALAFGLGDLVVWRQYKFHVNMAMVNLFLSPAGAELVTFPLATRVKMGLAVAGCLALAALTWLAARRLAAWSRHDHVLWLAGGVAALGFAALHLGHAYAVFVRHAPVIATAMRLPYVFPMTTDDANFALLGFHVPERHDVNVATGDLRYPLAPLQMRPPAPPKSVMVVLIDSWRPDNFSAAGMPRLYEEARAAQVFTRHLSGGNCTRPGVFSFFYGLPASYWFDFLAARREPEMVRWMREAGYQFAIHPSAYIGMPEFDRTVFAAFPGLADGNRWQDPAAPLPPAPPREAKEGEWTMAAVDAACVDAMIDFLRRRDRARPFFGFLFLDALHAGQLLPGMERPFSPTLTEVDYLALNNDFDPVLMRNLYNNVAAHVDKEIARLFAALRETGAMGETVVVVTGDHAQEMNETRTNCWGHNSNFSRYQIEVPLLLFWPGMAGARHEHRTSHFDIAPTILGRLGGCVNPAVDYSSGRDLFSPGGRERLLLANYDETALLDGETVYELSQYGPVRVYDLEGRPSRRPLPPAALQAAVAEMSRFHAAPGAAGK